MKRSVLLKVYIFLKKKWIEFFILLVGLVAICCCVNSYSSADLYYFGKAIADKNESLLDKIKDKDLKLVAELEIKEMKTFTLVLINEDLAYATKAIMEKNQSYLEKITDLDWRNYAMARISLDKEYVECIKNSYLREATMDIVSSFKKRLNENVEKVKPSRQQELKMYFDGEYHHRGK